MSSSNSPTVVDFDVPLPVLPIGIRVYDIVFISFKVKARAPNYFTVREIRDAVKVCANVLPKGHETFSTHSTTSLRIIWIIRPTAWNLFPIIFNRPFHHASQRGCQP